MVAVSLRDGEESCEDAEGVFGAWEALLRCKLSD